MYKKLWFRFQRFHTIKKYVQNLKNRISYIPSSVNNAGFTVKSNKIVFPQEPIVKFVILYEKDFKNTEHFYNSLVKNDS